MDNLSKCMIQCKKDGYGVHYGAWRAAQGDAPVFVDDTVPKGFTICPYCGKSFFQNGKRPRKYCDAVCQNMASYYRCRPKKKKKEGAEDGKQMEV